MNIKISILLVIMLFTNCSKYEKVNNVNKIIQNVTIDTIIEKCNPSTLDLTKHQLFIDTTRTYIYYTNMEKNNPYKEINMDLYQYLNEVYRDSSIKKVKFNNAQSLYISLNEYQRELILYDRCDGNNLSFGITDSLFYIFGVHEPEIRKIKKIIKHDFKETIIELEKFKDEKIEEPIYLYLQNTNTDGVYKLTLNIYNNSTNLVTTIKNIRNFNVLVNHCPENKVTEFNFELQK